MPAVSEFNIQIFTGVKYEKVHVCAKVPTSFE